jgi:hypothetical protein
MGRDWTLVWFSEAPFDPGYLNKRAEMWGLARDWLKQGGAIPGDDQVLYRDLIGPETVPRMDGKIQLESKVDMKRRGLPSPNRADSLVLSFAHPVTNRKVREANDTHASRHAPTRGEHDPYAARSHIRSPNTHNPYARR